MISQTYGSEEPSGVDSAGHASATGRVAFGPFEFDGTTGQLLRDGAPVKLQRQPLRVLELLVSRAGQVVTREEFQQAIWPDVHVDFEHNLNFCVNQVRRALGDQAAEPEYIETLPRVGYRFVKPVAVVHSPAIPLSASLGSRRAWRVVGLGLLAALLLVGGIWRERVADGNSGPVMDASQVASSLDAHDAFVEGRTLAASDSAHVISRSVALFQRAIRDDPNFVPARLSLADAYLDLGMLRAIPPDTALAESEAAVRGALERDPDSAEAHRLLGMILGSYRYDWDSAMSHLDRAAKLQPADMHTHSLLGFQFARAGRWDEALSEVRRALEVEPLDYASKCQLGLFEYLSGRAKVGRERLRALRSTDPTLPTAAHYLGLVQLDEGALAEGLQNLRQASQLRSYWQHDASLGFAYARIGYRAEADAILARLSERPGMEYGEAVVLTGLGRLDEAVERLDRARRNHDPMVGYLGLDPRLTALRDHSGARALFKTLDVRFVVKSPVRTELVR